MNWNLFGGMAIFGAVAAAWSQVKAVVSRAISHFVIRADFHTNLGICVLVYLQGKAKKSPFGNRKFGLYYLYVRSLKESRPIAYEGVNDEPLLFWSGWFPVIFTLRKQDSHDASMDENGGMRAYFIRGTINIEDLIVKSVEKFAEYSARREKQKSWRHQVTWVCGSGNRFSAKGDIDAPGHDPFTVGGSVKEGRVADIGTAIIEYWIRTGIKYLGFDRNDVGGQNVPVGGALNALALPEEVEDLLVELRSWLEHRDWFLSRNVPWRRGWTIIGAPGTGKSALIRAIGQDLDLPIYCFDLASMNNREFNSHWARCRTEVPCIVAFEDIDAVFNGRENITGERGGGLTFDCVLNCISGVCNSDGIFLVITTNRPETLDSALGVMEEIDGDLPSRPGRIDRILYLSALDEAGRWKIARRILIDWPEVIERVVRLGDGDTGAQFQERCTRVALEFFWKSTQIKKKSQENGELTLSNCVSHMNINHVEECSNA